MEELKRKPRIFFDMDGVLNVWELGTHIDVVTAPGYMKNRTPIRSMVEASKILADSSEYECWIASAVFPYDYSISDKNDWIKKTCPWFDEDKRIYIPYGSNKSDRLYGTVVPGDVFLDDYTQNLMDLHQAFGKDLECVKVVNGINDTNHSWTGKRISIYSDPEQIAESIMAFSMLAKGEKYDVTKVGSIERIG